MGVMISFEDLRLLRPQEIYSICFRNCLINHNLIVHFLIQIKLLDAKGHFELTILILLFIYKPNR